MKSTNKPGIPKEAQKDEQDSETEHENGKRPQAQREIGGPKGLEPTRYGDWEKGGRCIDF